MEKKIPQRQCVGCKEMKPKKELIRIVKSTDDSVFIDHKGKANGRGVYICPKAECLTKSVKTNAIMRSLGINIDNETYNSLVEELKSINGQ